MTEWNCKKGQRNPSGLPVSERAIESGKSHFHSQCHSLSLQLLRGFVLKDSFAFSDDVVLFADFYCRLFSPIQAKMESDRSFNRKWRLNLENWLPATRPFIAPLINTHRISSAKLKLSGMRVIGLITFSAINVSKWWGKKVNGVKGGLRFTTASEKYSSKPSHNCLLYLWR